MIPFSFVAKSGRVHRWKFTLQWDVLFWFNECGRKLAKTSGQLPCADTNSTSAEAGKAGFTLASVVEFMANRSNLCPPTAVNKETKWSENCEGCLGPFWPPCPPPLGKIRLSQRSGEVLLFNLLTKLVGLWSYIVPIKVTIATNILFSRVKGPEK